MTVGVTVGCDSWCDGFGGTVGVTVRCDSWYDGWCDGSA